FDSITKNLFLYRNPDSGLYEIFPWDNDATFGANWKGEYLREAETRYFIVPITNQQLFQRLLECERWKNRFWERVQFIRSEGVAMLRQRIHETAMRIRHDVRQDTAKCCSDEAFESSIVRLNTFLSNRAAYIKDTVCLTRNPLTDLSCSNPFPNSSDPRVVFRARSPFPRAIHVLYAVDLDMDVVGGPCTVRELRLYDDGGHDDGNGGDGLYANSISFDTLRKGVIPYCFTASGSYFPPNAFHYITNAPTHVLAVNTAPEAQGIASRLTLGPVYRIGVHLGIALENRFAEPLDLSFCRVRGKTVAQSFILPDHTILNPKETVLLTDHPPTAARYFPENRLIGTLFFDVETGDTLRMLSPSLTPIASRVCDSLVPIGLHPPAVVINEINYHSSAMLDVEDWVELYNPSDAPVEISLWQLKDERDDHVFHFPPNTVIEPHGYLVVCRDTLPFMLFHPTAGHVCGNLDFGFDSAGETIRLYSAEDILVDSVTYDDEAPWPPEADGSGATLELIDPRLDNALPENWVASAGFGTAGKKNEGRVVNIDTVPLPTRSALRWNYPDPFRNVTTIVFDLTESAMATITIRDVLGRERATALCAVLAAGTHSVDVSARGLAPGVYFYSLYIDGRITGSRAMHVTH
ncbi:MAG: hypothetical protein C0600_08910, partial [Ignavibacteria bacterium]